MENGEVQERGHEELIRSQRARHRIGSVRFCVTRERPSATSMSDAVHYVCIVCDLEIMSLANLFACFKLLVIEPGVTR